MIDKLEAIKERFKEVEKELIDPAVIEDRERSTQLNKEYKELGLVVAEKENYDDIVKEITENEKDLLALKEDVDFIIMPKEENEVYKTILQTQQKTLIQEKEQAEKAIQLMLLPKLPEDAKHAIVEIRAGTGGDEAAIFAGDLCQMYTKFCDKKGWECEIMDETAGTVGGFKEIILHINAENAYGTFRYEAGVHRVQRVPDTETQGRIHTSTASVIVLTEATELDVTVDMNDVRKDTFCSSGPGGQSVNTTKSAVRLTHLPTGIVTQCQDQKSQLKNFDKALSVLYSRIYAKKLEEEQASMSAKRKTMAATGERSDKIRTYNFKESRFTDHRINVTTYNLPTILNGELQEIIDKLQIDETTKRLAEGQETITKTCFE